MLVSVLTQMGFSEKEREVYIALLQRGPSSVRALAEKTGINRGTVYDILKSLREQGLVSYYHREKRRYFVAEDPEKIKEAVMRRRQELDRVLDHVDDILPTLKAWYDNAGDKPVVRYYEGDQGIRTILQDVIVTMKGEKVKEYCVYSSAHIRTFLYRAFPDFNKERLQAQIAVKVLAVGEGGELAGLDERRWLSHDEKGAPVYILIYGGKVALISVDAREEPRGVIIEDRGLAETHTWLFRWTWDRAG